MTFSQLTEKLTFVKKKIISHNWKLLMSDNLFYVANEQIAL